MVARAVPPVKVVYHFIAVPVATRAATVGEVPEQNDCVAVPVGAAGAAGCALIVTLADEAEIHPVEFVTVYV